MDNGMAALIAGEAAKTADPLRASRNLERLFESGENIGRFSPHIALIAKLFSHSQFLANHSVMHPSELAYALDNIDIAIDKSALLNSLELDPDVELADAMRAFRMFKRRHLMLITLRDLAGITDLTSNMRELSALAEAMLERGLDYCINLNIKRYGVPPEPPRLALIAFGKLGGSELNYSSDVDLMAAYPDVEGDTSGIVGPTGFSMNRISTHEFYCKVVETLNKLMSANTEDGIAYRVDLRLRPEGQKGPVAMPQSAYESYYQSWGRTWERMALIRARHVAGDKAVGEAFMKIAESFVWRGGLDYTHIEEIRALKKKIDSTFLKNDIKRGYGGIRELEFFVQTFQLLYGVENPKLRTSSLFEALDELSRMGLIPEDEIELLKHGYLYLRRLEHYLQMLDDLQTYQLPSSPDELNALAFKMGYTAGAAAFSSDLRVMRMKVKDMYNTLLGTEEDVNAEARTLMEGDLSEGELKGYLAFRGAKDADKSLQTLKLLRETIGGMRTPEERARIRRTVPAMLNKALRSESPDRSLASLEKYLSSFGTAEAYMTAMTEQPYLLKGMMAVFSLSPYLTRLLLSDPMYLNLIIEDMPIRKSMLRASMEAAHALRTGGQGSGLALYKSVEWLRLGMFYLSGVVNEYNLRRYLSHLAESMLRASTGEAGGNKGFCVVALGKLGSRELTYGGDLDIMFVSETAEGPAIADRILKAMPEHTNRGMLYDMDMRLRPDGSKGALVKDIAGYHDYYMRHAQHWEVQALIKSRFVAGDEAMGRRFHEMSRAVIVEKGSGISYNEICAMRNRIMGELVDETKGIDIKLGEGGMEEVEFFIEWLVLNNAAGHPSLIVQHPLSSLNRLSKAGVLDRPRASKLSGAYKYYSRLLTFLRLNEESRSLGETSDLAPIAAAFMGHRTVGELIDKIKSHRSEVKEAIAAT